MVQQIRKLVQFLLGDFEGAINSGGSNGRPGLLNNNNNNSANAERLRKLIPVLREYRTPLSEFGALLLVRLSEKTISRGLNWASERIAVPSSSSQRAAA